MLAATGEEERIVAGLHDAIEDGGLDQLEHELSEAPPSWLLEELEALTRREGEEYEAYIARAAERPIAKRVKVLDLRDNLDLGRIPSPTPADVRRVEKYQRALSFLLAHP
jgi:hypothetical protein